jgi:hypothetical protein
VVHRRIAEVASRRTPSTSRNQIATETPRLSDDTAAIHGEN